VKVLGDDRVDDQCNKLALKQWRFHARAGGHKPLKSWLGLRNLAGPQIVARHPKFSRTLDTLWSLDSQKNSVFDATKCQNLRLKCRKFDFRWGSAPDPAEEAYSAPQTP